MLAIEGIKGLSRDTLSNLTVVAGEDIGQYEVLKRNLLTQIDYDSSDLGISYFDIGEVDFQEVAMDLESLPFFAEEKVVILDYFQDITTGKKRYLNDEELKRLEAYLESPIETTKLIIFAPGKLDGKRRIVKLLKRDGQVFDAKLPKEVEIRQYFAKQAQVMDLEISNQILEEVLIKSNFDFGQSQKNLTFLWDYKGGGRISLEDIAEALPKTLQDNIFDLTQLILRTKVDEARSLVRDLTLQGEDEIKLLAIMVNQFRLFTQVKLLQQQGRREQEMVAQLSDVLGRQINPYQIKFALRDSQHLSLVRLQKALAILIETDFQIKSGLHDKAYLFDLALLKLAS